VRRRVSFTTKPQRPTKVHEGHLAPQANANGRALRAKMLPL
jgi:hypothetical protein